MMNILRNRGWWRTDDGRWFRHSNEDGSPRKGVTSVEWAWKPGEFGPYLGAEVTKNDGYHDNHKLFIGFLFGRVWLGFGESDNGPEKHWQFMLNRRTFEFCWNCTDKYGNHEGGKHVYFPWIRIADFIFGKTQHLCDKQDASYEVIEGVITLPEGDYKAQFIHETRMWYRARWPFRKVRYGTTVEIPGGIPFSGKGENSWDLGEDALYGTGISGKAKAEGWNVKRCAQHVTDAVLRYRAKRGDPAMWPMTPAERLAAQQSKEVSA